MKYCFLYNRGLNLEKPNEIKIKWSDDKARKAGLKNFIEAHIDKRIIIQVDDIAEFIDTVALNVILEAQKALSQAEITVCFDRLTSARETIDEELVDYLPLLKEIPFFFNHIITSWQQLRYYLSLGVSDVYIGEDLCFDLPKVRKHCDRFNVTIRTFPNVAQKDDVEALKAFFIRPDDVEYLSQYIDVLEFWGPLDRQETYHKIYTQGYWYGDLNEIIIGMAPEVSISNLGLLPSWPMVRANCRRDCLNGYKCTACERLLDISKSLTDQKIMIKHSKEPLDFNKKI